MASLDQQLNDTQKQITLTQQKMAEVTSQLDRATARAEVAEPAIDIANATLAAAIGLGLRLWIAGVVIFALGHVVSVWAARRDPQFVDVARRHLRFPNFLRV